MTDSVTLTLNVATYTTLASYAGQLTATVSSVTFSSNVTAQDNVIFQQTPQIKWATPAPIVYGTALSATQLDASSPVAGSFTYSPPAGTVLGVGQQTLTATLTPVDTTDYTTGTATVTLNVIPAIAAVTISTSANPVFAMNPIAFTASLPAYASTQTGTMTFYDGVDADRHGHALRRVSHNHHSGARGGAALHYRGLLRRQQLRPGNQRRADRKHSGLHVGICGGRVGQRQRSRGRHGELYARADSGQWCDDAGGRDLERPEYSAGNERLHSLRMRLTAGSGTTVVTLEVALPENAADGRSGAPLGAGAFRWRWASSCCRSRAECAEAAT